MKDQYVGDINDYAKYAVLKSLRAHASLPLFVCWMLTANDSRPDGLRLGYLSRQAEYEPLDPPLFAALKSLVERGDRTVSAIAKCEILDGATFHDSILRDDPASRVVFFQELWDGLRETPSLVFFDPDNGLEVKSRPPGKPQSSKYLYWREVEATYRLGHSLVIYQHFPRRPRDLVRAEIFNAARICTGAEEAFAICSSFVGFVVIPQSAHAQGLLAGAGRVCSAWAPRLTLCVDPFGRNRASSVPRLPAEASESPSTPSLLADEPRATAS
jgi:hypothetical protein